MAAQAAVETAQAAVGALANVDAMKSVMAGITIAFGGAMPAIAVGLIGAKAMESIGRNPESAGKIFVPMILTVAFAEAIAIYSFVMALIIKFV